MNKTIWRNVSAVNPHKFLGICARVILGSSYKSRCSPTSRLLRSIDLIALECSSDYKLFLALSARFRAVVLFCHSENCREWIKDHPTRKDYILVHPAVFHAAAIHPLNTKGDFSPKPFLRKVAQIAKKHYPDIKMPD